MSMNYNDYKAAVERQRIVASGEGMLDVYGSDSVHDMVDYDKITIYEAEHDREPATVDWLREAIGEPNGELGNMIIWRLSASVEIRVVGSLVRFMANIVSEMCRNPTRGDVLTALRLFKKEGA